MVLQIIINFLEVSETNKNKDCQNNSLGLTANTE